jgi:hypothetical protein
MADQKDQGQTNKQISEKEILAHFKTEMTNNKKRQF